MSTWTNSLILKYKRTPVAARPNTCTKEPQSQDFRRDLTSKIPLKIIQSSAQKGIPPWRSNWSDAVRDVENSAKAWASWFVRNSSSDIFWVFSKTAKFDFLELPRSSAKSELASASELDFMSADVSSCSAELGLCGLLKSLRLWVCRSCLAMMVDNSSKVAACCVLDEGSRASGLRSDLRFPRVLRALGTDASEPEIPQRTAWIFVGDPKNTQQKSWKMYTTQSKIDSREGQLKLGNLSVISRFVLKIFFLESVFGGES